MRAVFSREISPLCEYCRHAKTLSGGDMLCSRRGIVSGDYSCARFRYDPLKRSPKKKVSFDDFSRSDFSLK